MMKDDPYHQFFCEQTSEPIMNILEQYAKGRVDSFKKQIAQQPGASKILKKDLRAIQTKIDAILSQAEREIEHPDSHSFSASSNPKFPSGNTAGAGEVEGDDPGNSSTPRT